MKRNRFIQYCLAFVLLLATPALAQDSSPKQAVEAALKQWQTAVESGSVDDIMKLYDKHAVMISTFAQEPMTKHDEIRGYYKKVVANPDRKVEIEDSQTQVFNNNLAVVNGRYTISYTQEGEEISIPARFTFVYALAGGKWIIVDQHSSRVPLPEEKK